MQTISISEYGVRISRFAPSHAPQDVSSRRQSIISALEILRPVVRPLSIEVTFGPLDPHTYNVSPMESRWIASRSIPVGVANQADATDTSELQWVDDLTSDLMLRALTPDPPDWDFSTVTALVTAARIVDSELVFAQMPSHSIPMIELDGERWAVGPLDLQLYRLWPPIELSWAQDWGAARLTIEAHWSLWSMTDTPEYAALRDVERRLDEAGFQMRAG